MSEIKRFPFDAGTADELRGFVTNWNAGCFGTGMTEMTDEYPLRAPSHISESESFTLLRQSLPAHWIIREVSERDYGLDLYVEIVGEDRRLRGDLVAIQLKSQVQVEFTVSSIRKYTTLHSVKRSTLNYWLAMPVPVFLCLVCLASKRCYWVNIKRRFREGAYARRVSGRKSQASTQTPNPAIRIEAADNFSAPYLNRFLRTYEVERRWPEIESAIERGLTAYTSLGPLVLMCKRRRPVERCSSTLQYLLNSHWETFRTLSLYFEGHPRPELSFWYERNRKYYEDNGLPESYTFYFDTAVAMFDVFVGRYRQCLIKASRMVASTHKGYFDARFPLLRAHMEHRPLTFVVDDWYSRYFFDEYERETRHPEKLFFEDFEEYDHLLGDCRPS